GYGITPSKRHDLSAALHARPLFGQYELPAREILAGFRKQDSDLDRKREFTVEVLMKAIVVAWNVLQEKWGRSRLAGLMALVEEVFVRAGIVFIVLHSLVPSIGKSGEMWIER